MTLIFVDGAQGYNTAQILRKWATASASPGAVNATGGRRGGPSIRFSNFALTNRATAPSQGSPAFSADSTWIVGWAFKTSALPASAVRPILSFQDGVVTHITINIKADGTLEARRGTFAGTLLGTTTAALTAGVFAYLEVKVVISDTVGTVDIRKDGVSILALTAQDTRNAGNASCNAVSFMDITVSNSEAVTVDIDDIYICNGSGATNNTFLGDCRVDTTFPNGAGNKSQWTPSAGSNFQNVDEDPANDDTDYNFASVAATRDLYAFPDITPTTGTVYGTVINITARKDDATTRTLRELTRRSSADYAGSVVQTLTTSYAMYTEILETDPSTAAQWTIANVNLAEFGVDLVS